MTYIKIRWGHDFPDEPILLFSELDADRYEVRKVYVFRDGLLGFADKNKHSNNTELSICAIPPMAKIESEPEFQSFATDKAEFEEVWTLATSEQLLDIPTWEENH